MSNSRNIPQAHRRPSRLPRRPVEHLEEIKGGSAIILIRVTPLFRLRSLALITFVPVGDRGLDSLESNEPNTDLSTIAGRS